ncbi:YbaN family protein [Amorphus orientalis]|uniref:Uncharacterized membrane protein YbaN (DUF454 family) n=1 Tax=Amorphus orientalis TaxID=649198 RepID=A0AAE4AUX7_9HYPH|nr:YbaN family protein [Amorphus orientalis]MDQ0317637.1 uncharacterized membrane protein YbaN (DUF454 family) [Amorphus orientalis]
MKRLAFLALGYLLLALAFAGVVLPVLPTTPFVLAAAACFARSSPRLEAWLLAHPQLGPALVDWRAHGAIPSRAKRFAYAGMTAGYAIFFFTVRPGWLLAVLVGALMAFGAGFVASRPSGPPPPSEDPEDEI